MPNECTWHRAKEIFKVLSYDTDLGVVVLPLDNKIARYSLYSWKSDWLSLSFLSSD